MNKLYVMALLLVSISGCSLQTIQYGHTRPLAYSEALQVNLEQSQIQLSMASNYSHQTLVGAMRDLITQGGHLSKQAFIINGNATTLQAHQAQIKQILAALGVLESQLSLATDPLVGSQQLIIRTQYHRLHDRACQQGENIMLGCASTQALRAMVSDPARLIQGKPLGPMDGTKAVQVIDKYQTPSANQSSATTALGEW